MSNHSQYVTALVDTIAKKQPVQSSSLQRNELHPVPRGKIYLFEKAQKAPGNHLKIELTFEAGTWYFYRPHVQLTGFDDSVEQIAFKSQYKFLSEADYFKAAHLLNCEVAVIKALVAVEAAGSGFLPSGKPKILFEAHWFGQLTRYIHNASHPTLSTSTWNRKLYLGGESEWSRLERAIKLNRAAAIQSASWGLGQVMGFHWKTCGYRSVEDFFNAQHESEFEHLKCILAFIKSKGLDRHLRNKNWAAFSYGYNGSSFRVHGYHIKLAQAYQRFSQQRKIG